MPVALAVELVVVVAVVTVAAVTLPPVLVVVAVAVEVLAEVATTVPPAVNAFFTALSYLEFAYACDASHNITPPNDEYWLCVC